MDRGTNWSVTINNPTPSDEECIALARQKGWTVDGQLEQGKEGTPHYQLIVKTPQVRFSALKKAFPRAHIELARNAKALEEYVHKDDTKVAELLDQSKFYPSMSKYFQLVATELTGDIDKAHLFLSTGEWYIPHNNKDTILESLDFATRSLITQGYHVETICVNPQTRSAFAKFAVEILIRSIDILSRQRQAEIISQSVDIPTNGTETASLSEEEDDSSSCEESDGSSSIFSESEYT